MICRICQVLETLLVMGMVGGVLWITVLKPGLEPKPVVKGWLQQEVQPPTVDWSGSWLHSSNKTP